MGLDTRTFTPLWQRSAMALLVFLVACGTGVVGMAAVEWFMEAVRG